MGELVLVAILLVLPALVCFLYDLIFLHRLWERHSSAIKYLSSLGVIYLVQTLSLLMNALQGYVEKSCAFPGEGEPQCLEALWFLHGVIERYGFEASLLIGFIAQLILLRWLSRVAVFNKKLQPTANAPAE